MLFNPSNIGTLQSIDVISETISVSINMIQIELDCFSNQRPNSYPDVVDEYRHHMFLGSETPKKHL